MLTEAMLCLALNIYHESRDQSIEGMQAVAAVTMQRANHQSKNVCNIVFKPKQFSWANPLTTVSKHTRRQRAKDYIPTDERSWERAKTIARQAINRQLKSKAQSATHYYNPSIAKPKWRAHMVVVAKIGDHVFLR